MLKFSVLALALAAPAAADSQVTRNEQSGFVVQGSTDDAAILLLAGEKEAALASLERQIQASPEDPAVLINLGIAFAQLGHDAKAREAFNDALTTPDAEELEVADGRTLDSRRIARIALQMLGRGEFNPPRTVATQFTKR